MCINRRLYFYNRSTAVSVVGVLDVKKVGRALFWTGELFSGVEKRVSVFHYPYH
jgi:hypothetical protein